MQTHAIKKLAIALVFFAIGMALTSASAQTSLVSTGAVWKYWDQGGCTAGVPGPGADWNLSSYSDTAWPSGPAQLGYGDDDEATTLDFGGDEANKIITYYFRRTFTVNNASALTNLKARIVRDDGAVAYLNGVEIFRENMTNDTFDCSSTAIGSAVGGTDESRFFPEHIDANLLHDGDNLLAVEIHQISPDSSDISFDLELIGNPIPLVELSSPTNGQTLALSTIPIVATAEPGAGTNITSVKFYAGNTQIGQVAADPFSIVWQNVTPGNYTLTAVATDNAGTMATSAPVAITVQSPPPTLIVPLNSAWKYLVTGSDAPANWMTLGFNDAGWSGPSPAELGYGDGDEATVIGYGPDSGNKYITTYFRQTFNVIDPSAYQLPLQLNLVYDDGAVVYLNGAEIWRVNMPSGAVAWSTTANGAADYTPVTTSIPASLLQAGNNVLAVEIHQGGAVPITSSDISFALSMQGDLVPTVTMTGPGNGSIFTVPVAITLRAVAGDIGGAVSQVEFYANDSLLGSSVFSPYTYAWTNAIQGLYTLTAIAVDNTGNRATSAPVNITVVDPNPPSIVSANAGTTNTVTVTFSKPLNPVTATNTANYQIDHGVGIQQAELTGDDNRVVLTTDTILLPNTTYTLSVTGVQDASGTPITPNSQVTFELLTFDFQAIVATGSATFVAGGYDITSTGSDIGGNADQFSFNYLQRTGDFDVRVRVQSLDLSDVWAKAGLMARESLSSNSRYAAAITTPSINGTFFQYRTSPSGTTASAGSYPTTYPNTWLRLRRFGNVFTGFASFDGQHWSQLGTASLALPTTLYVGMALSSHSAAVATDAEFRDYGMVIGNPAAQNISLPREPLGPSSRKTPLAITEIMYHPRNLASSPGKSLEFVEIYNSQPWDEDISGYRISGDVDYTFAASTTIKAGGFLVVARDPALVQTYYGISGVLGPWNGILDTDPGVSTNSLPGGNWHRATAQSGRGGAAGGQL